MSSSYEVINSKVYRNSLLLHKNRLSFFLCLCDPTLVSVQRGGRKLPRLPSPTVMGPAAGSSWQDHPHQASTTDSSSRLTPVSAICSHARSSQGPLTSLSRQGQERTVARAGATPTSEGGHRLFGLLGPGQGSESCGCWEGAVLMWTRLAASFTFSGPGGLW